MKKEDLTAIGLTDEQTDAVFALNGKDIEKHKTALENAKEETRAVREQLEAANSKIEEFKGMDVDSIKKAAEEWETKYKDETAELKRQLEEKDYSFTVKEAVAGMQFTSESARKAFVADLSAKKLPLEDGKLLGLDDYVKAYREGDPGAFVPEHADKTPVAVRGGTGGAATGKGTENMTYTELCKFMAENPNVTI